MKIDSINKTSFGLRKLTSLQDLAKQKGVKITPMESSGIKDYAEYIKKIANNMKRNAAKAIETAKKIFIK